MEIISILKRNARTSVSDIAKRLKISNTAVKKRMEKLEKTGVISGYTAKVNDQILGKKKALLILHVPFENSTVIINSILRSKEDYENVFYRSSSSSYMFYIITAEDKSHRIVEKFKPFVKSTCPITLMEKLL